MDCSDTEKDSSDTETAILPGEYSEKSSIQRRRNRNDTQAVRAELMSWIRLLVSIPGQIFLSRPRAKAS